MKGAKDLVILKLEALGRLEVPHVGVVLGVLGDRLRTPLGLELLLLAVGVLRRRDARSSAGSAVVVVAVVVVRVRGVR